MVMKLVSTEPADMALPLHPAATPNLVSILTTASVTA